MLRKICALTLALTLLFTAFGCSSVQGSSEASKSSKTSESSGTSEATNESTSETTENGGGVLRIVTAGKGSGIGFPAGFTGYYERIYSDPALESLARIGEDKTSVEPWLAEDITVDAENLTMVVTLREGIQFSDGTPFNAEAVIANWNYYIENGSNRFNNVEKFEATGEYEVTAYLSEYDNSTVLNTCVEGGWMISPTFYEENGDDVVYTTPVGTGPFVCVSSNLDSEIIYEKNENYWQEGKPYLDGIEITLCSDSTTAMTIFKSGDADIILFPSTTQAQELEELGYQQLGSADAYFPSTAGFTFSSNVEDSPVSDVNVRKAICYAIDSEAITKAQGGELFEFTNQLAVPGSESYNEEVEGYPYDPEKAKELLAEAGYADGFTITATGSGADQEAFFTLIQAYLQEVGITLEIEIVDSAVYNAKRMVAGDDNYEGLIFLQGAAVKERYFDVFGENPTHYARSMAQYDDVNSLTDVIKYSTDDEEVEQALMDFQSKIIDEYCLIHPMYISGYLMYATDSVVDSGLMETHKGWWTPADCKLQ